MVLYSRGVFLAEHAWKMMNKNNLPKSILFTLVFVLAGLCSYQTGYSQKNTHDLASKVASIKLGMNGYIIGTQLSEEQKKSALSNVLEDSYEGTYKFHDGEVIIVVENEQDLVLAVYQRDEKATLEQAGKMISGLMSQYGEPTTMAHEKLVYWAYNDQGKIPEDTFRDLRKKNEKFDVLATVKFNSTFEITAEKPDEKETGIVYFIISSDPLIQQFLGSL